MKHLENIFFLTLICWYLWQLYLHFFSCSGHCTLYMATAMAKASITISRCMTLELNLEFRMKIKNPAPSSWSHGVSSKIVGTHKFLGLNIILHVILYTNKLFFSWSNLEKACYSYSFYVGKECDSDFPFLNKNFFTY